MKRHELEKEGRKWVEEGIITEDQLERILSRTLESRPNFLLIVLAVLLTGLGFLTFIMSDWAREPHISRVLILLAFTLLFYIAGEVLYRKNNTLYGISFIVLGYIVFGSSLLLVIDIYNVVLFSAWPFSLWTMIGLVLYYIYRKPFLFVVMIIISTIGQIYSGISLVEFDWIIFLLTLIGAGYLSYRENSSLYQSLVGATLVLQSIVWTAVVFDHYYWYMLPILLLYFTGEWLRGNKVKRISIMYISLLAILLFNMYQSFLLQDEWYAPKIPDFDGMFLLIWLVFFLFGLFQKWKNRRTDEWIDFVLFLPILFLPLASFINLIVLFLFAIGWIVIGYKKDEQQQVMHGTIAFLLSTLTVYIQYAWDAMDKSLFFFIGGVLLFILSFIIERQRRKLTSGDQGGDGR